MRSRKVSAFLTLAQFDVFRLGDVWVVDLQSDIIGLDRTRLVAPLRKAGEHEFLSRLTPIVNFNDEEFFAHIHDMATVTTRDLGEPTGSISDAADDLLRAIDILTRGF